MAYMSFTGLWIRFLELEIFIFVCDCSDGLKKKNLRRFVFSEMLLLSLSFMSCVVWIVCFCIIM